METGSSQRGVSLRQVMRAGRCGGVGVEMAVVAFSSLARTLGECSIIHSLPALVFLLLLFFFFEVEIGSHTLIPFFRPGSVHSDSSS